MNKLKIIIQFEGYFNVGVAKYLQDNLNCEIYAIVDTNKQVKDFFLEQKFVEFKKVWYLRDHLVDLNIKPDLEYLSSFEKKYKINLWQVAHTDRILYPQNNFRSYHKFSRKEILQLSNRLCNLYENIFEEVKPDFILLRTADNFQGELLLQFSHAKKIITLIQSYSRFWKRWMISSEVDIIDDIDMLFKNCDDPGTKNMEELQMNLKNNNKEVVNETIDRNANTNAYHKFKDGLYMLSKVVNDDYRKHYANFGRTKTKILMQETSLVLKKIIREYFINKHLKRDFDRNSKFVYYPLHLNPERTTLNSAPFYVNQLEIITNLAKSLPIEYKLYVKEHPAQSFWSWRDTSYYKYIMNLPNVELLHPAVSMDKLLKYCSLVTTISGTSALEAAFNNKPSIVFTDTIFSSVLPSVYRIRSMEDLPNAVQSSLKKKVDIMDLRKYTKCILDNTFEFEGTVIDTIMEDRIDHTYNVPDVKLPQKEIIAILEDTADIWNKVGKAFVQKINFHIKSK